MIRALSTLVAIAALTVSAAPASAGGSKQPPQRFATGIVTDNKDPDKLNAMFFPWDMAAKAPPKTRRHQRTTDVPDGTSNTTMWSGSKKPPNGIIAILIG